MQDDRPVIYLNNFSHPCADAPELERRPIIGELKGKGEPNQVKVEWTIRDDAQRNKTAWVWEIKFCPYCGLRLPETLQAVRDFNGR